MVIEPPLKWMKPATSVAAGSGQVPCQQRLVVPFAYTNSGLKANKACTHAVRAKNDDSGTRFQTPAHGTRRVRSPCVSPSPVSPFEHQGIAHVPSRGAPDSPASSGPCNTSVSDTPIAEWDAPASGAPTGNFLAADMGNLATLICQPGGPPPEESDCCPEARLRHV